MGQKSIGEALVQATARLKESKNMRADKIMKVGILKQALCEVVQSPSPKCIMGMDISHIEEYFPYLVL